MRTYTFRKQIRTEGGCYAEIVYDIIYIEGPSNSLSVKYLASDNWEAICRAGVYVFYDYFARVRTGNVEVTIYDVIWMPVDTNNLIVFYACISALTEALDIEIKDLKFDVAKGIFSFPEKRSLNLE